MNPKSTKRASLAIGAVVALTATVATFPEMAGAASSGGVSISETNDGLVVKGSPSKDFVSIVSAPDGAVDVRIRADNGQLVGHRLVSDFTGNLRVDLGANDDAVYVEGLELEAVKIEMGAGSDRADLNKVSLSSLAMNGGEGDDYLGLRDVRGESARMATGKGKGWIAISDSVLGMTDILTGSDDDLVTISRSSLGDGWIGTQSGDDRVTTDWALFTHFHLALGEGDDHASIDFDDDLDASHVVIYGEDGDDTLTVTSEFEVIPQTIKFNGGADHDTFNSAAVEIWSLLQVEEIAP
ncbi:MAG: hypothetical protein GY698_00780 [Actinomycetia bacterium]|nr:hypothetical protein [Actinomycetes bacterium]